MRKRPESDYRNTATGAKPPAVREPVQVYLGSDDAALLTRLSGETGHSKAEVLRRGIRSFAREQGGNDSPMLRFVREGTTADWPEPLATRHDDVLASEYRPPRKKRTK